MTIHATLPFSRDEFLAAFEHYNLDVWPAPIGLLLLAITCTALLFVDRRSARVASLVALAGLWLWTGAVYHFAYFSPINPAAWGFGGLCLVEAGLLCAVAAGPSTRASQPPLSRAIGAALVAYALVVYPLLGALSDHPYPRTPTFGLPCPTTIFTFGALLLASQRVPWWLFVIPTLWALVGSTAPFQFGIWEDLGLLVAAVLSAIVLVARARLTDQPTPTAKPTANVLAGTLTQVRRPSDPRAPALR